MIITLQRREPGIREVTAPPSKSYTHRALIMAALGSGQSMILNPLYAEDTLLTMSALRMLGISLEVNPDSVVVNGCNGTFNDRENTILDLNNSGTSLRLLAPLALLCRYPVTLTGSSRMQERPIGPLTEALQTLGGSIQFLKNEGYPPLRVSGHLQGGTAVIEGSISSQFISSILIAAPYAVTETEVIIPSPPVSGSYLDITLEVMQAFGVGVKREGYTRFLVSNKRRYTGRKYAIEGDYSSSSYFFAIAAICGGRMTVKNLEPGSVQGDRRFPDILASMGCTVTYSGNEVTVERSGKLHGITVDMATCPDTVQTLCMVAAMADTPTTITGISHLKFKESDRITSTAERLKSLGGDVQVGVDRITINPAPLHGGVIDPENDHRTAMSFAVLGLCVGGITIANAECVNKSFPEFWNVIRGL
jgi:3-phosphoshikimate 1-carboxyvinyltransferase